MELLQWACNKSLSKAGKDIQTEHDPQQIPGCYPRPSASGLVGGVGGGWRGGVVKTPVKYISNNSLGDSDAQAELAITGRSPHLF